MKLFMTTTGAYINPKRLVYVAKIKSENCYIVKYHLGYKNVLESRHSNKSSADSELDDFLRHCERYL